uniref:phenylalanine--tRNA ligase n=1 Tax=Balbiania investiens TaxID=111861 RepID=A0A4D6BMY2_9FLOR|nr:Phenylalanine-tRNA ligase beta subunit [Balbiania investiens]QBX88568.1 Phenylalanine-tRNA ligase beta subunit [Balbiania investiens]
MNISWKWLKELINLKGITPQYLAEKLTLAGFEVENIETNTEDTILDISSTANRSDTLCMVGIAREISALLQKPLIVNSRQSQLTINYRDIGDDEIRGTDYVYTKIQGIEVKRSPVWLQDRLKTNGITCQNNLLDILSLLTLKWGQYFEILNFTDMHNKDDPFETIWKHKKSNALKPNLELRTGVQDILISALIIPKQEVKHTSQCLDLFPSKLSAKNIRINRNDIILAYSEAIALIKYLCRGKPHRTICRIKTKKIYKPLEVSLVRMNNILGPILRCSKNKTYDNLQIKDITEILTRLNFSVKEKTNYLAITVPEYRLNDISRDVDIIEEIGRVYGFDNFLDKLPKYNIKGNKNNRKLTIDTIRSVLRTIGLTETVHYSLTRERSSLISIYNPLTEDCKSLRKYLLEGLIASSSYNIKQGNEPVETFEIGRVFSNSQNIKEEKLNLSGIIGGKEYLRNTWSMKPTCLTWFQAKGEMEEIFERLEINIEWVQPDLSFEMYQETLLFLDPKKVAMLRHENKTIGIFGQIRLRWSQELNIPERTYLFELEIDQLTNRTLHQKAYNHALNVYSKYPSIIRDIAIISPKNIPVQAIVKIIKENIDPLVESISLFDVYDIYSSTCTKSLGFRIKYRSNTMTLRNKQVDKANCKIEEAIKAQLPVQIRLSSSKE